MSRFSRDRVRTVPRSVTRAGITLNALDEDSTEVTETTIWLTGSALRLTMVWSARTRWRGGHRRVDRLLRLGGVAALALHGDLELVGGGEEGPGADREGPHRAARPVVHPVDLGDLPAVHHAVRHHLAPAAAALLGGLEDHQHGAVEVARLGRGTWRRRAASPCARRGRRRASRPASWRRRARPSPRRWAARPCRRAGRWSGPTPSRGPGSRPRRRSGRSPRPPRRSRTRAAARPRGRRCGASSNRISGCSWRSRRQAVISGSISAKRFLTGMAGSSRRRPIKARGGRGASARPAARPPRRCVTRRRGACGTSRTC